MFYFGNPHIVTRLKFYVLKALATIHSENVMINQKQQIGMAAQSLSNALQKED